jgi:hypothetical protein
VSGAFGDAPPVVRVATREQCDHALLNVGVALFERARQVVDEIVAFPIATGSGLKAWTTSGNFKGSRMKNTFRLLPTKSQLPSSV